MKTTAILFPRITLFIMIGSFLTFVHANVSISNLFSSHMVLQRNTTVPIWGTASSGEQVTVTFNGQTKSTSTATNGKWKVILDTMPAGGPYSMTIKGNNSITISDVYMGEVWQCAGQSNMDTRVSSYSNYSSVMNSTNIPLLRYYTLRQPGETPVWATCTSPALVGKLSCLGFFFGKELQKTLGTVAVGLVVTAVGGTTVGAWLDPTTLSQNPSIATNDTTAGDMYAQWVAPVVGCAMRGTVWMQGEQDRASKLAPYYAERFSLLIKTWRKLWGIGDFPFYYVQLANYSTVQTSANETGTTPVIREGQRLALSLPNTAMAVAIDIGDVANLHFTNKQEAGARLALPAKALLYGQTDLAYSGPLFVSKTIDGSKIHCKFSFTGTGMVTKDGGACKGFAIAGSNGQYVWGDAVIHGDTVTVSSSSVSSPANVRYAYAGNPVCNLYNKEGLPASPFSTEGAQVFVTFPERGHSGAMQMTMKNRMVGRIPINALGRITNMGKMSGVQIVWRKDLGITIRSLTINKIKK